MELWGSFRNSAPLFRARFVPPFTLARYVAVSLDVILFRTRGTRSFHGLVCQRLCNEASGLSEIRIGGNVSYDGARMAKSGWQIFAGRIHKVSWNECEKSTPTDVEQTRHRFVGELLLLIR